MPRQSQKISQPLRSVQPNAGLAAYYKRRLASMIRAMHRSVMWWVAAAYRKAPPAMAQDAPADNLARTVASLKRRWQANFDEAAEQLADWFAKDVEKRSSAALKRILKNGGYSVKFRMTKEMRDVLEATIQQQVGLIKSIPQKYLGDVEGAVMRSVQAGRDLEGLTKELEASYGVTRKRAAFIARDQNNKATGAMVRARQQELGLEYAIWMHSHAGKEPRPTHVKMNGKRFKIEEGMYDSAEDR